MRAVLHIDGSGIFRRGTREVLTDDRSPIAYSGVSSPDRGVDELEGALPDLLITDLSFPARSGLDVVRDLRDRHPDLPILVVAQYTEELYGQRCLAAGANGYLHKVCDPETLIEAARTVLSGSTYVSESMRTQILSELGNSSSRALGGALQRLSDREMEVLQLIGEGQKASEIADTLQVSTKTVHTYKARAMDKLGCASSNELVRRAILLTHDPDNHEIGN